MRPDRTRSSTKTQEHPPPNRPPGPPRRRSWLSRGTGGRARRDFEADVGEGSSSTRMAAPGVEGYAPRFVQHFASQFTKAQPASRIRIQPAVLAVRTVALHGRETLQLASPPPRRQRPGRFTVCILTRTPAPVHQSSSPGQAAHDEPWILRSTGTPERRRNRRRMTAARAVHSWTPFFVPCAQSPPIMRGTHAIRCPSRGTPLDRKLS